MRQSLRIAVVFDNFGPYHVARLTAAARRMDVLAVEVRAKSKVYDWKSPDLPGGLAQVTLAQDGTSEAGLDWNGLFAALDREVGPWRPDCVAVAGWSGLASLAAATWAIEHAMPAILMSESNALDATRHAPFEAVKRHLVRQFSAGLSGGELARSYLISLGLPADGVFLGYNAVDNSYFARSCETVRASGRMPLIGAGESLDARWRGRYFLASARFIPVKNLAGLLDAYAAYRAGAGDAAWPLVILGDGTLRGALEEQCAFLGLGGSVYMPGFRQYNELPEFYGTAGALVHASTMEPWGLVVNEAMASGLPVLVSDRCGCAATLVSDGVNGFTCDPKDIPAIARAMTRLTAHSDLASLGEASRARVAAWGPDRFGEGLHAAAHYARVRGPACMAVSDRILVRAAATVQARRS